MRHGSNRIDRMFQRLGKEGRTALVPYITAGHPQPGLTVPLMHEMTGAGADLIELGVPFSDPMADGPVIQRACEVALKHGTTLARVLEMLREFRDRDSKTPVVLMGYLNPVLAMGIASFARRAAAAGADGVLVVDMPPEEGAELSCALGEQGLCQICLLSPTTSERRMQLIASRAGGFVYYVALRGVTGADTLDRAEVERRISAIRQFTALPVAVGFGIKDAESAAAVARDAEAVVIGSALVERLDAAPDGPAAMDAAGALVRELRAAIDGGGVEPRQRAL